MVSMRLAHISEVTPSVLIALNKMLNHVKKRTCYQLMNVLTLKCCIFVLFEPYVPVMQTFYRRIEIVSLLLLFALIIPQKTHFYGRMLSSFSLAEKLKVLYPIVPSSARRSRALCLDTVNFAVIHSIVLLSFWCRFPRYEIALNEIANRGVHQQGQQND